MIQSRDPWATMARIVPLVLLSVSFSAGCQSTYALSWERSFFNPRFRPDGQALVVSRPPVPPMDPAYWTEPVSYLNQFSDASQLPQREVVSELVPDVGASHDVNQLFDATCYWLGEQDEVALFWEVVDELDEPGYLAPEDQFLGTCAWELGTGFHPYDRRNYQTLDGSGTVDPPTTYVGGDFDFRVLVERRVYGAERLGRFASCTNFGAPTLPEPLGPGLNGACPAIDGGFRHQCQPYGCRFTAPRDSRFVRAIRYPVSADVDLANQTGVVNGWRVSGYQSTGPQLRSVAGARTLARPLTYDEFSSSARGTAAFIWETEVNDDGTWRENFNPTLRVFDVRVVRRRGDLVEYVWPRRIEANGTGCSLPAMPADGYGLLRGCEALRLLTPTYFHATPSRRIDWFVEFTTDPREEGSTEWGGEVLVPHGELYIEFVVVHESLTPEQSLSVTPRHLDFGDIAQGYSKSSDIVVTNVSPTERVQVDRADLPAGSSVYRVVPQTTLPTVLEPFESTVLRVTAEADPSLPAGTTPTDQVQVEAQLLGSGLPIVETTDLEFEAIWGPIAIAAPESLSFWFAGSSIQSSRAFLIANAGNIPLERDAIGFEDVAPGSGHASAFSLRPPFAPGTDPSQPSRLEPGADEVFWVHFSPDQGNGEYEAYLVVPTLGTQTGQSEVRIRLNGWYPAYP